MQEDFRETSEKYTLSVLAAKSNECRRLRPVELKRPGQVKSAARTSLGPPGIRRIARRAVPPAGFSHADFTTCITARSHNHNPWKLSGLFASKGNTSESIAVSTQRIMSKSSLMQGPGAERPGKLLYGVRTQSVNSRSARHRSNADTYHLGVFPQRASTPVAPFIPWSRVGNLLTRLKYLLD